MSNVEWKSMPINQKIMGCANIATICSLLLLVILRDERIFFVFLISFFVGEISLMSVKAAEKKLDDEAKK